MTDKQKQKVRKEFREHEPFVNLKRTLVALDKLSGTLGADAVMNYFESYLIQKLEDQERELVGRAYKKGMSFAYHTCDCDYCHKKNLEVLSSLKQDENN